MLDDVNRAPATEEAEKTKQAVVKPLGEKESGSPADADHAGVSNLAQALNSSSAERLEQLRLAVQSGHYDVPAEAVAQAIVDHHTAD
jgi:anti-sigma28 factor (negative regulator of flagellin synthesis)